MKHRRTPTSYGTRSRGGGFGGGRHESGASDRRAPTERHAEHQLVFGIEPIRELIAAAPQTIQTLYFRDRDQQRFASEVERVRASGGQAEPADDATLSRIAGRDARHQGIAAIVRAYNYAPLEEMIGARPDPLVLIDGVTDPHNLGAILRSAEGAGANAVILARDRTCPITPAAIKSSAGAWVHLRIARCGNVARMLEELKEAGYWIAALTPDGETSLYEIDTSRRLALVIGSEGRGVRELVAKNADFRVSIPMRGRVNSLNVSVATGIALFEISRRRNASQSPKQQQT